MPPLDDDDEETQALGDPDSPSSPSAGARCEEESEDPILYGETQALDDPDGGFADDWGKTQVVDGYEDTAVDEERTLVLSDNGEEEGLEDDGTTQGEDGEGEDGGKEKEVVVDSDATTDEECDKGDQVSSVLVLSGDSFKSNTASMSRTFAAVRAASLRSSGLAAARSISPKVVDVESKSSFDNGKYCKEQDHNACDLAGSRPTDVEISPNRTTDIIHPGTQATEINQKHDNEKCQRDKSKSRINNSRVRKLFDEMTSSEKEETTKLKNSIGKEDLPLSQSSYQAVGGLSYIGSQEPGDQSQANAFDVVENFLFVNDLGSSQDAETRKGDIMKSPPVSSAKGVHYLANKADHRSPVGKKGVYEWIDSLEDEGGGDFFSKRKELFFRSRDGERKSRSQPPKCRHLRVSNSSGIVGNGEEDSVNPKIKMKRSFACSDSRLMLHSSSREKAHPSEAKTRRNLLKDMDEKLDSKSQLQPEPTDAKGEGCIYDVGLDTQMAAEAIEALIHGSLTNYEKDGAHPEAGKTSEDTRLKKTSLSEVTPQKRTSSKPVLGGVSTRSRQRKKLSTKPRGSSSFSNCNSIEKGTLEDTTVKRKAKGKQRLEQNSDTRTSVKRNKSSRSIKRGKTQLPVDVTMTKETDNCRRLLAFNAQLPASKELIPGEYHVHASPVAHRTRHSKAVSILKPTKILTSDNAEYRMLDVSTHGDIAREDELVADACAPLKSKRKGADIVSDRTGKVRRNSSMVHDIDGLHGEEMRMSSPLKDDFAHNTGNRTGQSSTVNAKMNGDFNNLPMPADGIEAETMKSSTQQGRFKVKSISEILDTANRKRRSVTCVATKKNAHSLNRRKGKVPLTSGVRTRSSVNAPSSGPFLEDACKDLGLPVSYEAGFDAADISSTVGMNHSVHPKNVPPPKEGKGLISHVEVAEEKSKLDNSPKEKLQASSLACTTPSKDKDAMSPVCVAQVPSTVLCNRGLSRSSVARELLRLEATEKSSVWTSTMRRRKDMANVRVLFSHHLDDDVIKHQKKIMGRLGISIAFSISDATHFVTDKFVRTRNMLEAMAVGKPVVTHMWLESCGQASCFIDERNYILRDAKKEKEIGFSMPVSLARASQCPLLKDRRVFVTPNAKPDQEVICSLVELTHGQPMKRIGRSAMNNDRIPDDLLVLSCEEDYSVCLPLLEKGADVYSSELLLNGIVIQKLEYERHRLFLDHVKRTRSTIWLRHEDGNQFLPVNKCT